MEEVENLLYMLRHQREVALGCEELELAVRNTSRHVMRHRKRRVRILLAMPKLYRQADLLESQAPRANHKSRIPLRSGWSGTYRILDQRDESLLEIRVGHPRLIRWGQ